MWLFLPLVACAFLVGAGATIALGLSPIVIAPLLWLVAATGAALLWRRPPAVALAFAACALMAGAWRASHATAPAPVPAGDAQVLARVLSTRPAAPDGVVTARVAATRPGDHDDWRALDAIVQLRLDDARWVPRRGDAVFIRGTLRPPGRALHAYAFDPQAYARSRGHSGRIWLDGELGLVSLGVGPLAALDGTRIAMERSILTRCSTRAAGVLVAITTGSRGALDPGDRARFGDNGAAHVLAVSGLHLGILTIAVFAAARRLAAGLTFLTRAWPASRIAALFVAPLIVGYVVLTGAPASAVRAGIMAIVMLVGVALDRRASALHGLSLSALVMAAYNPAWLADIGFQLSVSATASLVLAPSVDRQVSDRWTRRALSALSDSLRASTVATLATAPVLLWHFGRVPVLSPFTNLFVVPPIALVGLPAGLVGALLDASSLPGAGAVLALADHAVRLSLWVAEQGAGVLDVQLTAGRPGALALAGWTGLALASPRFGVASLTRHVTVGLCCAALIVAGAPRHGATLSMHAIPVGQGDATLLTLADGTRIVIDGGGSRSPRSTAHTAVLPYLDGIGVARVDVVAASHADFDHAGGLPDLIDALRPREVWVPADDDRPIVRSMRAAAARVGAEMVEVRAPFTLEDAGSASLLEVWPGPPHMEPNDAGLVMRACVRQVCFLLTGDIEEEREAALLADGTPLHAAVLKVPHHGSRTSSTEAFIDAVLPVLAVVHVGEDNRFGFPLVDVMRRYTDRGILVRRTDRGAVVVWSDGDVIRVNR